MPVLCGAIWNNPSSAARQAAEGLWQGIQSLTHTRERRQGETWSVIAGRARNDSAADQMIDLDASDDSAGIQGWGIGRFFPFPPADLNEPVTCVDVPPALTSLPGNLIVKTGGTWLNTHAWGRYSIAAVASDGMRIDLFRDPSGFMTIYWCQVTGGVVFATELSLLIDALPERPAYDWDYLALYTACGAIPMDRTGFVGVHEVQAGQRLVITAQSCNATFFWNPFDYVSPHPQTVSVERLNAVATFSLSMWLRQAPAVVIYLSGGLDSAVIAALAHQVLPKDVALETLHFHRAESPNANELEFSTILAQHIGLSLHRFDIVSALHELPLNKPRDVRLARLNDYALGMDVNPVPPQGSWNRADGVEFLDGNGGDEVFFSYLRNYAHILDYLSQAGRATAWRELVATSDRLGDSIPKALRLLSRTFSSHQFNHPERYIWVGDYEYVPKWLKQAPSFIAALRMNPVLSAPRKGFVSPLRVTHAVGMSYHAPVTQRGHPAAFVRERLHVLHSLPIMQLALGLPVHQMTQGGRNRILLRQMAEQLIPSELAWRHDKAVGNDVIASILYTQQAVVEDLLCNGVMAHHGAIDIPLLRTALHQIFQRHTPRMRDIYSLLMVERWLLSWENHTQ